MPLYDFRCRACGAQFEEHLPHGELRACPRCGAADPERLLSPFAGPFTVGLRGAAARRSDATRRARAEQRRDQRRTRKQD